jgi:hypothetical protein
VIRDGYYISEGLAIGTNRDISFIVRGVSTTKMSKDTSSDVDLELGR